MNGACQMSVNHLQAWGLGWGIKSASHFNEKCLNTCATSTTVNIQWMDVVLAQETLHPQRWTGQFPRNTYLVFEKENWSIQKRSAKYWTSSCNGFTCRCVVSFFYCPRHVPGTFKRMSALTRCCLELHLDLNWTFSLKLELKMWTSRIARDKSAVGLLFVSHTKVHIVHAFNFVYMVKRISNGNY